MIIEKKVRGFVNCCIPDSSLNLKFLHISPEVDQKNWVWSFTNGLNLCLFSQYFFAAQVKMEERPTSDRFLQVRM